MKIPLSIMVERDVLAGLERVATSAGTTAAKLVGDVLQQIAEAPEGEVVRLVAITPEDLLTFFDMAEDMGYHTKDWNTREERRWMGAAAAVAAKAHRDRQAEAGSRLFIGGAKGEPDKSKT